MIHRYHLRLRLDHLTFTHTSLPIRPPVHSRASRPDHSGTPRGHRTPRGQYPSHHPRGGRSDNPDRPQRSYQAYPGEKERRDRQIDAAFKDSMVSVKPSTVALLEALQLVLSKRSGIRTEEQYNKALNDVPFQKGSKHFSYLFRHSLLPRADGSLSLHELLNQHGTIRKLRHMRTWCSQLVLSLNRKEPSEDMKIRFYSRSYPYDNERFLTT